MRRKGPPDPGTPPRWQVILETDFPEQRKAFEAWAAWAGLDLDRLDNTGCGCCVDIYAFACPPDAVARLRERLKPVGAAVDALT